MEEVITVNFDTQTVSARELHKEVGSTERFSAWFDRQLQYGFVENTDYTGCKKFNTLAKQELQDYNLTIDMAKQICMVQKNERAREVRQYLIDLEKAWNTPEQIMARALKMADQTINKLKAENHALVEKIEQDKPKTIFADAVSASDTSMLVRDVAKMIRQNGVSIGEKRFYKWLRDNGYICRNDTSPTQKAMDLGLFEIVVRTVERGNSLPLETKTTRITGKGQQYFVNKFLGGDADYGKNEKMPILRR